MEAVETQLPSSVSSPQLARAFLRSTLETWKLDGFGEVTELLATELVANVVTHVGAPMTLRVQRGPSTMPGATVLTLMLCGPSSRAKLLVMPRSPHFEAE